MMNAVKARNGIVMNPSQLMYCPVQGTRPQAGAASAMKDIFCKE